MKTRSFRTVRYARSWVTGRGRGVEEEIFLDRAGMRIPATLVHPGDRRGTYPAWVVLHGITRRGRAHAQLSRFTHAIVSTGAVAIVPEVPEWTSFSLAPRFAIPTLEAGIRGLRESGRAVDAPVGVVGFSFGAPHALAATAHPALRDELAGAVSFGGYCDLARTVRFLMTGAHEWNGRSYRLTPDPYGRWIVGANYLTAIEDHRDAADVARALGELAAHAGDTGISSLDPCLDPVKESLRRSVEESRRGLFDLFAPPSAELPEQHRAGELAEALVEAALRRDPEMDPRSTLALVRHPVHLLHGRRDHLIPFTESLRLRDALRAARAHTTITRLFGHSAQDSLPSMVRAIREVPAFAAALRRVLRLV